MHFIYPALTFYFPHGQSKSRSIYPRLTISFRMGNRIAFHLPCTQLFPSARAIETHSIYLGLTFSSARAIETHSFYHGLTFSFRTGNRIAFHLPYALTFSFHTGKGPTPHTQIKPLKLRFTAILVALDISPNTRFTYFLLFP